MDATPSMFDRVAVLEPGPAPDPCARKHGGNERSQEAWERTKRGLSRRKRQILSFLAAATAGGTCDEVAHKLDTTPNAISGRFTDLAAMTPAMIRRTGTTRKTATKSTADVWELTQAGKDYVQSEKFKPLPLASETTS